MKRFSSSTVTTSPRSRRRQTNDAWVVVILTLSDQSDTDRLLLIAGVSARLARLVAAQLRCPPRRQSPRWIRLAAEAWSQLTPVSIMVRPAWTTYSFPRSARLMAHIFPGERLLDMLLALQSADQPADANTLAALTVDQFAVDDLFRRHPGAAPFLWQKLVCGNP